MKITKKYLQRLIKEEAEAVQSDVADGGQDIDQNARNQIWTAWHMWKQGRDPDNAIEGLFGALLSVYNLASEASQATGMSKTGAPREDREDQLPAPKMYAPVNIPEPSIQKEYLQKIIEEEVAAALNLSEESIKDKEFEIDVKHCVENEGKGCRQDTDDFWKAVKKAMASEGLFDQTVAKVKTRGAKIDDMFKKSGAYTSQRGMKRESQQGVNKLTEAPPGAITEDIWNKLEEIYYKVRLAKGPIHAQALHMVMKRVKKHVAKAKSMPDGYKKLIAHISKRYPAFESMAAAAGLPMVR